MSSTTDKKIWKVFTTAHPPAQFHIGQTQSIFVEYFSDDAEPLERKDEISIRIDDLLPGLCKCGHGSGHHTSDCRICESIGLSLCDDGPVLVYGEVVGGDVEQLVGTDLVFSIDRTTRRGTMQLWLIS